ncbi:unnamed protein product [Closterium sp. NIES-54]
MTDDPLIQQQWFLSPIAISLAIPLAVVMTGCSGIVQSERIAEAMKQIDRADYVLTKSTAYEDSPQPIGFNVTISAPHMHGYCLAFLENHLQPGNRVLDVGSGSGYLTAVMALLVGPTGRAVGVEHIPELVERSRAAVKAGRAAELMDGGQLSIHEADGRHGYPDAGPYDAIHVGAAAPELPQALVDQLKPGGRMVIPVGRFMQDLEVIDKGADGTVTRTTAMGVRYVPLTAKAKQLGREGHNSHGRAIHAADCYGEAAGEGVRETERSEWVCEEVSE